MYSSQKIQKCLLSHLDLQIDWQFHCFSVLIVAAQDDGRKIGLYVESQQPRLYSYCCGLCMCGVAGSDQGSLEREAFGRG